MKLEIDCPPKVLVRIVLPTDSKEIVKSKLSKQFINKRNCTLTVIDNREKVYRIKAKKNYCFDGATIPFNIGKGDTRLQIPALFHDIMCENKWVVNYNRKLSSQIFRELLVMCGEPRWKANTMYFFVDNYQKLMGWNRKKNGKTTN